jgi:hypothetical protein
VAKILSDLGLAGSVRKGKAASGSGEAVPTKTNTKKKAGAMPAVAPQMKPTRSDRGRLQEEIDLRIHRPIFRLAEVGGQKEIEDGLRRVRR